MCIRDRFVSAGWLVRRAVRIRERWIETLIERYSTPEMVAVWTEEAKMTTWLEVELAVCEAWAELGEVPDEALADIRERAAFDVERVKEIEETTHHDVIAFLTNVAEHVGDASKYIHFGMTSSDMLDTARAVSSMSEEVMPKWMYLEASPTCSATFVRNAITSWWVVSSISFTRSTSKAALSRISARASSGTSPSSAQASHTASSTSSQVVILASSVHTATISGVEYRSIKVSIHLSRIRTARRTSQPAETNHLGRQNGCIPRTIDCNAGNGHPGRHLHNGEQRIQSPQVGGADRYADHRQLSIGSHHSRKSCGLARTGNDHLDSPSFRRYRILPHSIRVTMSGENVDLMTYPPLLKLLRSGFHDLTITLRPHQNAHQRWIHTEVLRVRVNLRLSCGFSGHSQLDLPFLFQLLRLFANIGSVLRSSESDVLHGFIRARPCLGIVIPKSSDCKYPSAIRDQAPILPLRSGMKHIHPGKRGDFVQPGDHITSRTGGRVSARRHHHRHTRPLRPFSLLRDLLASRRSPEDIQNIGLQTRNQRLRFRIPEAAVELQNIRTMFSQHEAGIKHTAVMKTPSLQLVHGGADDGLHNPIIHLTTHTGDRRIGTHPPGIRSLATVKYGFVVLSRCK